MSEETYSFNDLHDIANRGDIDVVFRLVTPRSRKLAKQSWLIYDAVYLPNGKARARGKNYLFYLVLKNDTRVKGRILFNNERLARLYLYLRTRKHKATARLERLQDEVWSDGTAEKYAAREGQIYSQHRNGRLKAIEDEPDLLTVLQNVDDRIFELDRLKLICDWYYVYTRLIFLVMSAKSKKKLPYDQITLNQYSIVRWPHDLVQLWDHKGNLTYTGYNSEIPVFETHI